MANQINTKDAFAELLDEDGPVTVAGIEFNPSDILKSCDPIAFRVGISDYESSMVDDGTWFEWSDGDHYDEEEPTDEEDEQDTDCRCGHRDCGAC
ncbi:hypothetical protein CMP1-68 [Clavibacter phage CMP1]|uniref:Uncharacterized protein n=1 Tax=Clavibacter phage CMP1 TaxID=686439 RepID=D0U252_9CAUD|nr:hypothetical protein CMP1-68 [Clavibacter phage CMP1]ACY35960.1 hypothetical protein CMP1-68 [Clavibacter phage CMP1]